MASTDITPNQMQKLAILTMEQKRCMLSRCKFKHSTRTRMNRVKSFLTEDLYKFRIIDGNRKTTDLTTAARGTDP